MRNDGNFLPNVFFGIGLAVFVACLFVALLVPENGTAKNYDDGTIDYAKYVDIGDYKSLETTITSEEVSQEDIDAMYEKIKTTYGSYDEDTEGVVDEGDFVTIEYTMTGYDTPLVVEGIVGGSELSESFSKAVLGKNVGETVIVDSLKSGDGKEYVLTVEHIHIPAVFTDESIASMGIEGVTDNESLMQHIKDYLQKEKGSDYLSKVQEDLIAKLYNASTFYDMPEEYVKPFKDILQTRLDNARSAYALQGEEKSYDEILADTYKKDGISSVDEYLNTYGTQNARIYAMCLAISRKENIKADTKDVYSLAASDWANVKDSYTDLKDFLEKNSIEPYEQAALLQAVKDYLLEVNTREAE